MGGTTFTDTGRGATAQEAFTNACSEAQYEHGHGGYTGTIAEKHDFIEIPLPEGKDPFQFADELIENDDPRVRDKWGPAGCVKVKDGEYLFFGWASC